MGFIGTFMDTLRRLFVTETIDKKTFELILSSEFIVEDSISF